MKIFAFENRSLRNKLYWSISIIILISASLFIYSNSTLSRSLIYLIISVVAYMFLFKYLKEIRKSISSVVFNGKALIVNYQDLKKTPLALNLDEISSTIESEIVYIQYSSNILLDFKKEYMKNKDQWKEFTDCFKNE